MTLQQLRYFCVMAEVLHYTKTANQLYISQPSLSYALSELARELGMPLFEKRGKKTYLTKYGEAFLPYAKRALAELAAGEACLLQMSDPTLGNISLGYIYSVGFDFMPQLVEDFYLHQGNRNISFNFQVGMTTMLLERLVNGSLDLVIATPQDNPLLDYLTIFEQELFLIVPENHALAEKHAVTLDDIKNEKLISINRSSDLRKQIEKHFHSAALEPQVVFEVDDCNSMAAFVSSKMGLAIMPRIPALESYRINVVPIIEPTLKREICLIWDKGRNLVPAAKCFRDFVKSLY